MFFIYLKLYSTQIQNATMLNTLDIHTFLSKNKFTKPHYRGVFAMDKIPKLINIKPSLYVINTDNSNQSGTHWLAIYVPAKGKANYFDSFGRPPKNQHIKLFFKNNHLQYIPNRKQLQGYFSTVCGQYCCMFLLHRSRNRSMKSFLKQFNSKSYLQNDAKINTMFRKDIVLSKYGI